jgi:hypothetical protein
MAFKLGGKDGAASFLTTFTKMFDRYRFSSLVAEYYPSVGTQKDGAVVLAVDLEPSAADADYSVASSRQFVARSPVWGVAKLPLPGVIINAKTWYENDETCCVVEAAVSGTTAGTTYGEVWVSYVAHFEGARGN